MSRKIDVDNRNVWMIEPEPTDRTKRRNESECGEWRGRRDVDEANGCRFQAGY
jgi:hypothetical protein